MFVRSGGSALLAIVFHGGINAINAWTPAFVVTVAGTELSGFAVLEMTNILIGLAVLLGGPRWFFRRLAASNPLFELAPSAPATAPDTGRAVAG